MEHLHNWLLSAGMKYRENDSSYVRVFSDTFSLEVDANLAMHIVVTTDAMETDITSIQLSFEMLHNMSAIERALHNTICMMNEEKLSANLGAAMKMLEKRP